MSDHFDWDDVDTIVPAQGAIAVYENPHGNVVVREQVPYPEDDKWIIFLPQYAEVIVRRIIEVAGLPFTLVPNGSSVVGSSDKPKDCTAAERQRRRRNKLRKARDSNRDDFDTVTGVTETEPPATSDRAQLVLVRSPAVEGEEEVQATALTR
ncbi:MULTISPECIES: hypothetical protein [unclassified Bradyrhizobium]|uniref:hypothetical protein n=1 Tax=unclassified Bradyrhizobium TaxID=2631580 RepID=UPI001FF9BEE9|nr:MULTISPECIES: hypothetical protein [unclassified Bradyrhizobium]MCK1539380.1 hypothetical protein [Bradyrhizobium sp. 176]MCK1558041.1 hypothetical protein [Bradyrhizobium sp. 171]